MKRRGFLGGAVALGASSVLARPAFGNSHRRILRIATLWPTLERTPGIGAEYFAKQIAHTTEGRISVEIFPLKEGETPGSVFEKTAKGEYDAFHGSAGFWRDRAPGFAYFGSVPFGMTGQQFSAWLEFGDGQKLWDSLAADYGLKPMLFSNTGPQMGGWFRAPINTPEDIKGLRLRISGLGGMLFAGLGGKPEIIARAQVYNALREKRLDAAEWLGPWNDYNEGFHRLVRNYYYPSMHERNAAMELSFNKNLWERLSTEDKMQITLACQASRARGDSLVQFRNAQALETLVSDHGVRLREFPPLVRTRFAEQGQKIRMEYGQQDPDTRKIAKDYDQFQTLSQNWTQLDARPWFDTYKQTA